MSNSDSTNARRRDPHQDRRPDSTTPPQEPDGHGPEERSSIPDSITGSVVISTNTTTTPIPDP